MEPPEPPQPPELSTSALLGRVVAVNFAVLLALSAVGGVVLILALPVLNMLAGGILLFTERRRLGKVMLVSGLVTAILGLGTCALILANLRIDTR